MRLDLYLVQNGFAPNKSQALNLIREGAVLIDGKPADKGGKMVNPMSVVAVAHKTEFVSRGAKKLLGALDKFNISVTDKTCGDFGASTGGFTQVLLQNGAKKVYAIDVGKDQLNPIIASDSRVVEISETNVRNLKSLPEKLDFACVDLSFISLKLVLENIASLCSSEAEIVLLFKPQFEAGKDNLNKAGLVKPGKGEQALEEFKLWLYEKKFNLQGVIESPITGQDGNQEYLLVVIKSC